MATETLILVLAGVGCLLLGFFWGRAIEKKTKEKVVVEKELVYPVIIGERRVRLVLLHLGKNAESKKDISYRIVLAQIKARGLLPAGKEELLAFEATYPELQREFPILAPGSVSSGISPHMPVLRTGGLGERELTQYWIEETCTFRRDRFLAIIPETEEGS